MRALIEHLLKCNREQVLARSLMHCHGHNLHSVMLLECPGKTIRLFIAEPGHELTRNTPERIQNEQSVAFHAHHCDLTLAPIHGEIGNWTMETCAGAGRGFLIDAYHYQSAITHGKIGFEKGYGLHRLRTRTRTRICAGESEFMPADVIHTVYTPDNGWAAWLAFEGAEDPSYKPVCYSFTALDKQDFSGYYKPMPEVELERLMRNVGYTVKSKI